MHESLALSFFLLSYFVCLKFYQTLILTLIVKHRCLLEILPHINSDTNRVVNVTLPVMGP